MDQRNLIDHYKYWNDDAIRADLDVKRHNFSVVCCNIGNEEQLVRIITPTFVMSKALTVSAPTLKKLFPSMKGKLNYWELTMFLKQKT
jgi:hypothetical protein